MMNCKGLTLREVKGGGISGENGRIVEYNQRRREIPFNKGKQNPTIS